MGSGWRNALAALAVLGGLGALVAAPAVVAQALPDEGPVPAGQRIEVGYGVSLRPPPGARFLLGPSRPGSGEVDLRANGVAVRLTAVEFSGSTSAFVAHARHKLARDDGLQAGAPRPVTTDTGVRGEQAPLTPAGRGRPGCYAVFVAGSTGVVVVVTPAAGCDAVPQPVRSAVASLAFEAGGDR